MSFRKHIQMAWNSLSYADAGEMLTRREKHRLLSKASLIASPQAHTTERMPRRAVAMPVGDKLTARMLDYAIDSCQRLRAELVLLAHGHSDSQDHSLASSTLRIRTAGIHSHVVTLNGDWDQAVNRYVRAHHEIIFLILSALDVNSHSLLGPRRTRKRHGFPVPLVLVDEKPATALPAI
jgi:hypothetical protein